MAGLPTKAGLVRESSRGSLGRKEGFCLGRNCVEQNSVSAQSVKFSPLNLWDLTLAQCGEPSCTLGKLTTVRFQAEVFRHKTCP